MPRELQPQAATGGGEGVADRGVGTRHRGRDLMINDVAGAVWVGGITLVLVVVLLWVRVHRPPGLRLLTRLQVARALAKTGRRGWCVPAQLVYAGPPRDRSEIVKLARRAEAALPAPVLPAPVAKRLSRTVPGRVYLVRVGFDAHIWRRHAGLFLTEIASLRVVDEKITVLNDDPDRLERETPDRVLIWYWVAADFGLSFRLPHGWLLPWQR